MHVSFWSKTCFIFRSIFFLYSHFEISNNIVYKARCAGQSWFSPRYRRRHHHYHHQLTLIRYTSQLVGETAQYESMLRDEDNKTTNIRDAALYAKERRDARIRREKQEITNKITTVQQAKEDYVARYAPPPSPQTGVFCLFLFILYISCFFL